MIDSQGKSTEEVLRIARDAAMERNIGNVVVATTRGDTAEAAAGEMAGTGLGLVAVTHSTGFREPGEQELPHEVAIGLVEKGVGVVTGTMPFHGINDDLRKKGYYSTATAMADALRMMGQGTKVCVEIACMAVDAGAVPEEKDIVAVAGTHRGADTVLIIRTACTRRFLGTRIKEVIAKPVEW
jgi:hypothetical protein